VAFCVNHPETDGIGVCVRCRNVLCEACCTRLRGINHCPACLKELARPRTRARGQVGSVVLALGVTALLSGLFFGLLLALQGRLAP
jgi:hypothetical protein